MVTGRDKFNFKYSNNINILKSDLFYLFMALNNIF